MSKRQDAPVKRQVFIKRHLPDGTVEEEVIDLPSKKATTPSKRKKKTTVKEDDKDNKKQQEEKQATTTSKASIGFKQTTN